MIDRFQEQVDDELTPNDNRFSASTYRVIHFVTDVPIRVPSHLTEFGTLRFGVVGTVVYIALRISAFGC